MTLYNTTYGFCHNLVHFSEVPPGQAPSSKVLQKCTFGTAGANVLLIVQRLSVFFNQ